MNFSWVWFSWSTGAFARVERGECAASPISHGSGVFRLWLKLRVRRKFVVDHDIHAGTQFEDSGRNDGLPGLQTVHDIDEIALSAANSNELLTQDLLYFAALLVFLLVNHEHRIAI